MAKRAICNHLRAGVGQVVEVDVVTVINASQAIGAVLAGRTAEKVRGAGQTEEIAGNEVVAVVEAGSAIAAAATVAAKGH